MPDKYADEILHEIMEEHDRNMSPEKRAAKLALHRNKPRLTLAVQYDAARGKFRILKTAHGADGIALRHPEASFTVEIGLDPESNDILYADIYDITDPELALR